ncbi:hypothetical protein GYMLUDRAFT_174840 [Collybiopsis luxurians FD-317 M1]|uniref:3'-5' exonuclease domain-containing protein n=1 Tax=Collybiopsis luxurians FD-317 M1 TaxID=944289 RepID=A0A0D0BMQ1_9AGAR|nr:hypothetical protein GYMLUDRAFT_174840 [Collybiopsis luxurians FD-317 M1]
MDQLSQSLNNLELNPVFTLCDSELSFSSAIAFLQSVPSLVIDCEGLNLGVDGGSLSVISIRSQNETFVFDIPSLTCPLDPLFDILMNPGILKILFDGRMDFCALYYRYGIPLTGVIDLQLADIKSRFIRQESLEEHNKRLRRCFSFKQVFDPRNAHKYEPIHVLQGLGACLIEHKCTTTAPKKQGESRHPLSISPPHLLHLLLPSRS